MRIERGGPLAAWVRRKGQWEEVVHAKQLPGRDEAPETVQVRWRSDGPPRDEPVTSEFPVNPMRQLTEGFSASETVDTSRGRTGRERAQLCLSHPNEHPLAFVAHVFSSAGASVNLRTWYDYHVFRCAGRYSYERAGLATTTGLAPFAEMERRVVLRRDEYMATQNQIERNIGNPFEWSEPNLRDVVSSVGCLVEEDSRTGGGMLRWDPAAIPSEWAKGLPKMKDAAKQLGIRVVGPTTEVPGIISEPNSEGWAARAATTISVGPNTAHVPAFEATVMAHEISHLVDPAPYLLADPSKRENAVSYAAGEIVAETSAALIGTLAFGTEIPPVSEFYIASYMRHYEQESGAAMPPEKRQEIADRVQGTVGLLLGVIQGDPAAIRFTRALVERNTLAENWGDELIQAVQ